MTPKAELCAYFHQETTQVELFIDFLHVILILKFPSQCLVAETHPESEPLILTCLIGDTPTLCSTPGRPSACTSPSRPSSPAPARTGKSFLCQTACQVMCLEF